jgi:hypothetical protein
VSLVHSDVSEERTALIFRVTELVQVDKLCVKQVCWKRTKVEGIWPITAGGGKREWQQQRVGGTYAQPVES